MSGEGILSRFHGSLAWLNRFPRVKRAAGKVPGVRALHRLLVQRRKTRTTALPQPQLIHLNLTSACNLRCRICRPDDFQERAQSLSRSQLEEIVGDLFDGLSDLRLDSSGELLLSRELEYVLGEATKRNIPTFICTNATLLTEEKADLICRSSVTRLQISIDSSDKQTLEWIRRGAKFEEVIAGASNLVRARNRLGRQEPRIVLHAALLQQNIHQIKDMMKFAKDLGVDEVTSYFGFIHSYMDPQWSVFWIQDEYDTAIREALKAASRVGILFSPRPDSFHATPAGPAGYCDYLFEKTYIDADGQIFPCCLGQYALGDLRENRFSEIWHGQRYEELRRTYNTSAPAWEKCASCYIKDSFDPQQYRFFFHPDHWPYVRDRLAATSARKA